MLVLYGLSIVIAWIVGPPQASADRRSDRLTFR